MARYEMTREHADLRDGNDEWQWGKCPACQDWLGDWLQRYQGTWTTPQLLTFCSWLRDQHEDELFGALDDIPF